MFTVAKILEMLPREGGVELKTLEKMLKLTKKIERARLDIALNALTKLKIIEKDNENFVKRSLDEKVIKASIRCSSKGYCFAVRDDGEEDIYIRENFLNHAWHGDKVLVKITKEGVRRRSPEGEVLCILQRTRTNILASLVINDGHLTAKPLDERILSTIELPEKDSKYLNTNNENNIIDVKINRFPLAQLLAKGEIVRKLSLDGGPEGDLEIIKTKYNLSTNDKPPNVAIKKPLTKQRKNLEEQPSLLFRAWHSDESPLLPSIYAEPSEGGFKLWVHVPAVSERINLGSKLDEWIKNRSKSICLGNTWQNLLSSKLLDEAGFKVDEINSAITIEVFINKEGEATNWDFYLSTIKPVAIINEEKLNILIKRKPGAKTIPAKLKSIKNSINTIESIIFLSNLLNNTLMEAGLIELDSDLPKISNLKDLIYSSPGLDLDGWMPSFMMSDPQSIISLLTKYSNIILSKHFKAYNIDSINLSKPFQENLQVNDIIKSALLLDTQITLDDEGTVSLTELLKSIKASPNKHFIQKLAKNYIIDYKYKYSSGDEEDLNEYSNSKLINFPLYDETPWSNPGMNYADIINQYILCKFLVEGKQNKNIKPPDQRSLGRKCSRQDIDWQIFTNTQKSLISKLCSESQITELNTKRNQAKFFRQGLISIIQLRSVEKNINQIIQGTITGVQSYGFFVEIEPSLAEGLVHVSSLDDDWYEYRSRQNLLVGRKNKKTYQIGDNVNVKIQKVDLLRNQIDLDLYDDESITNNDKEISIDSDSKIIK